MEMGLCFDALDGRGGRLLKMSLSGPCLFDWLCPLDERNSKTLSAGFMCSDEAPFRSQLICCNQPAICRGNQLPGQISSGPLGTSPSARSLPLTLSTHLLPSTSSSFFLPPTSLQLLFSVGAESIKAQGGTLLSP